MASVQAIAKAKATAFLMNQVFGLAPEIQYYEEYARVYYPKSSLPIVRSRLRDISTSSPGDVRIEWFPIVQNELLKKSIPVVLISIVAGYLLSKC